MADKVVARWDYEAQEDNEISFRSGDVITVVERHNDDWWEGEVDGVVGYFPANRVSELSEGDDDYDEEDGGTEYSSSTPVTSSFLEDSERRNSGASALQHSKSGSISLPEGWRTVVNDQGQVYYHDTKTNRTSWTPPNPDVSSPHSPVFGTPFSVTPQGSGRGSTDQGLPPNWKSVTSADGRTYFFNVITKETSWIRPEGESVNLSLVPPPIAPRSGPPSRSQSPVPTPNSSARRAPDAALPKAPSVGVPPLPPKVPVNTESNDQESDNVANSRSSLQEESDASSLQQFDESVNSSQIKKEGALSQKVERLEGKKSGSRSWRNYWVVLHNGVMLFYKEPPKKGARAPKPKPIGGIDLKGAILEWIPEKPKRKYIFSVTTARNSLYLFQANSEGDLKGWLDSIGEFTGPAKVSKEDPEDSKKPDAAGSTNIHAKGKSPSLPVKSDAKSEKDRKAELKQKEKELKEQKEREAKEQKEREAKEKLKEKEKTKRRDSDLRGKKPNLAKHSSVTESGLPVNDDDPLATRKIAAKHKINRWFTSRPSIEKLKEQGIIPEDLVFGGVLQFQVKNQTADKVPPIVKKCIQAVEKRGIDSVGIYRVSGNTSSIQKLRLMFNQAPDSIDFEDEQWSDINVITGSLKQYFRELQIPLIPYEYYDSLMEAARVPDYNQRLITIKNLILALPDEYLQTLEYLIRHLARVAAKSSVNKMDSGNIAIVFGPTLIKSPVESMESVLNVGPQTSVVESLISQVEWMFDKTT